MPLLKSFHTELAFLQPHYWPLEHDADRQSHPTSTAACSYSYQKLHFKRKKRSCIKIWWRMLFPPVSLPSQGWCGNWVGFAQKCQEVISNISVFLSIFPLSQQTCSWEDIKIIRPGEKCVVFLLDIGKYYTFFIKTYCKHFISLDVWTVMIKVQAVLTMHLLSKMMVGRKVTQYHFHSLIGFYDQVSGAKGAKRKKLKFTSVKNSHIQA